MKRLLLGLALVFLAVGTVGCKSSWEFWKEDVKGATATWRRDLHRAHKTFDWYFLNYDWDDPYL